MITPLKAPIFGRDTSATDQVRYGVIVSGAKLFAESVIRILRTPRGSLLDDPAWGYSLADRLGAEFSQADADAVPSELEGELGKDDRARTVTVTTVLSKLGAAALRLKISIAVELATGGSFSMVVAYQDLKVTLQGLNFGETSK